MPLTIVGIAIVVSFLLMSIVALICALLVTCFYKNKAAKLKNAAVKVDVLEQAIHPDFVKTCTVFRSETGGEDSKFIFKVNVPDSSELSQNFCTPITFVFENIPGSENKSSEPAIYTEAILLDSLMSTFVMLSDLSVPPLLRTDLIKCLFTKLCQISGTSVFDAKIGCVPVCYHPYKYISAFTFLLLNSYSSSNQKFHIPVQVKQHLMSTIRKFVSFEENRCVLYSASECSTIATVFASAIHVFLLDIPDVSSAQHEHHGFEICSVISALNCYLSHLLLIHPHVVSRDECLLQQITDCIANLQKNMQHFDCSQGSELKSKFDKLKKSFDSLLECAYETKLESIVSAKPSIKFRFKLSEDESDIQQSGFPQYCFSSEHTVYDSEASPDLGGFCTTHAGDKVKFHKMSLVRIPNYASTVLCSSICVALANAGFDMSLPELRSIVEKLDLTKTLEPDGIELVFTPEQILEFSDVKSQFHSDERALENFVLRDCVFSKPLSIMGIDLPHTNVRIAASGYIQILQDHVQLLMQLAEGHAGMMSLVNKFELSWLHSIHGRIVFDNISSLKTDILSEAKKLESEIMKNRASALPLTFPAVAYASSPRLGLTTYFTKFLCASSVFQTHMTESVTEPYKQIPIYIRCQNDALVTKPGSHTAVNELGSILKDLFELKSPVKQSKAVNEKFSKICNLRSLLLKQILSIVSPDLDQQATIPFCITLTDQNSLPLHVSLAILHFAQNNKDSDVIPSDVISRLTKVVSDLSVVHRQRVKKFVNEENEEWKSIAISTTHCTVEKDSESANGERCEMSLHVNPTLSDSRLKPYLYEYCGYHRPRFFAPFPDDKSLDFTSFTSSAYDKYRVAVNDDLSAACSSENQFMLANRKDDSLIDTLTYYPFNHLACTPSNLHMKEFSRQHSVVMCIHNTLAEKLKSLRIKIVSGTENLEDQRLKDVALEQVDKMSFAMHYYISSVLHSTIGAKIVIDQRNQPGSAASEEKDTVDWHDHCLFVAEEACNSVLCAHEKRLTGLVDNALKAHSSDKQGYLSRLSSCWKSRESVASDAMEKLENFNPWAHVRVAKVPAPNNNDVDIVAFVKHLESLGHFFDVNPSHITAIPSSECGHSAASSHVKG